MTAATRGLAAKVLALSLVCMQTVIFAPTHALVAGSLAIDNADDDAAPSTDQRGVGRPKGAPATLELLNFKF